ncbi:ATP-binding protein [Larsenimonas salina]|uniref:ATP-binding protein n=1 Tax=Larsenimonas salina TaxID=1295565 RepID=UPI0020748C88|nr:ATP-binding protein [Larsenimonas salina]MCM5705392.1 ATP-binding protein [Larsenimonas salina]
MFKHLGLKLFASILLVNILISGTIYWTMARSIDNGFIDYIRTSQEQRIDNLAQTLISSYRQNGKSWNFLERNSKAWRQLLRFGLGPSMGPPHRERASSPPMKSMPTPPPPLTEQSPHLPPELGDPEFYALFDSANSPIAHAPRVNLDRLNRKTLSLDGQIIGVLGYPRVKDVIGSIDKVFINRQLRNLGIIMGGTLLASLVLSAGLGWWIGRRAKRMASFTQTLIQGDFTKRLTSSGRDELARLSQDLNALAITLDHNRQAREQWVADIAHELRTPLAVLKGELEAIADGIRQVDTSTITSLTQEVDQLNRLVEDLRVLAQSDAKTLDTPLVSFSMSDHLRIRLDESRYRLEAANIALVCKIEPDIDINGDEHRLRQLWNNLLDNTLFYTDAPGTLKVTLKREPTKIVVLWEDSAPGVPEDALDRLTERLYRVEASRNRRHGGSGLGLSIASAMVRLHRGHMIAEQTPLGGLRWRLEFPLEPATRREI